MPKCGCAGLTCGCAITAGSGVTVSGTGTAANPFVVSVNPFSLNLTGAIQVSNSNTIEFSKLGSGGSSTDPLVISGSVVLRSPDAARWQPTIANDGSIVWSNGALTTPGTYTDEQAHDAVAALIAAGTHSGISFVYDDAGNKLSATVTPGAIADATSSVKGAIQLGGDLAGTASAPTVPGKANLASPTFTGTPAAPSPAAGDSSTRLATTAFVAGQTARVFTAPQNFTGTSQYIRVATVTTTSANGAEANLLVSGLGNIGFGTRSIYSVSLGIYGTSSTSSSGQLTATPLTQQNDSAVTWFSRQTGNFTWEVWALVSAYQNPWTVQVLSGAGYTINLDSVSTTAPSSPALTAAVPTHQTLPGKMARVTRASAVSLPTAQGTAITLDVQSANDDAAYFAQSGGGVQIKIAGLYQVNYWSAVGAPSAGTTVGIYVQNNGTTFSESHQYLAASFGTRIIGSAVWRFAANDVVKMLGYSSAAAAPLNGSSDQKDLGMAITRIGY